MSTDRDDAAARRYREASAALDERPSAATRAAILAAAARQVEARPRPADAPRAAHRPRWPLAAAAAVLLSTLAVMMANRTGEEMPAFTAPAERAPSSVAVAPAPPVAATPSADSAAPELAPPVAKAPAPAAKRPTPAGSREERGATAVESTERADALRSDAANAAASARAVEQAPDVTAAKPEASPVERAAAREAAPAAQGAARLDAAKDFEGSAPLWLERIVKLRSEGRDAEADVELKRFRERYPDVQVPPAALPRAAAGTR